jgi:hypothetical protein
MTSRKANIEALLSRTDKDLAKIEREYNDSLHAKSVDQDLRIDIKNLFENLRSVLDYLAHNIRERFCSGANPSVHFYFPIFSDKPSFDTKVDCWYPGLRINSPDLLAFLESIQPYQPNMEWLGYFNQINSANKHGDLVEQTRSEWEETRVKSNQGSQVSWRSSNVTFGHGVSIMGVPVDPGTQLPIPHPSQRVERITWVDFQFSCIGISALGLIKKSVSGIKSISASLTKWI